MEKITLDQSIINDAPPEVSDIEALQGAASADMKPEDYVNIPMSGGETPPGMPSGGAFIETQKSTVNAGSMINGMIAVNAIDAFIPSVFVLLLNMAKIKLKKSELQLTEKEKQTIAPLVENCLTTINIDFSNPWVALSVTAGIIYIGKIVDKAGNNIIDGFNFGSNNPVSEMKQPRKRKIKEPMPPHNLPFTDEQIDAYRKKRRWGRETAISFLIQLQRKGTLPETLD